MFSPAEDMSGRIEAETSSSTLEEEFPPDLLEKTMGKRKTEKTHSINSEKDWNLKKKIYSMLRLK